MFLLLSGQGYEERFFFVLEIRFFKLLDENMMFNQSHDIIIKEIKTLFFCCCKTLTFLTKVLYFVL